MVPLQDMRKAEKAPPTSSSIFLKLAKRRTTAVRPDVVGPLSGGSRGWWGTRPEAKPGFPASHLKPTLVLEFDRRERGNEDY